MQPLRDQHMKRHQEFTLRKSDGKAPENQLWKSPAGLRIPWELRNAIQSIARDSTENFRTF